MQNENIQSNTGVYVQAAYKQYLAKRKTWKNTIHTLVTCSNL